MDRRFRIAIYMRLSKGDSAGEESGSIRMQRMLLREFAAARFADYELLEFEDDGYSGTNFRRPGVERLLELARNLEIDCIIVKDFSRFSRDYIELGAYLEQIFPFMGIRFISVNDGYDSDEERYAAGELEISFKNLLYDLYSRDLSVKVRSALETKKAGGQYISTNSPFGYRKAEGDRHMLVIAEDEARVVRRVFALTLQGYTSVEIARLFNEEGVRTPLQFRLEMGGDGQPSGKKVFLWQSSTVCQILRNQTYVGDLVYGKTEKRQVGGKSRLKPRSQWKVCPGHHEPVIDRQIFEAVQENRGRQKRKTEGPAHPLTGRLVCGGCGRKLCIRKGGRPYFTCPCRYVSRMEDCVKRVDADYLEYNVLRKLRMRALQAAGEESLKTGYRKTWEEEYEKWRGREQEARRDKNALTKQKVELYEVYCAGKVDVAGYQAAASKIAERERKLDAEMEEAGKKTAEAEEKSKKCPTTEEMLDGLKLGELTGQIVSEWIQEILVYHEQRLEIHWKKDS